MPRTDTGSRVITAPVAQVYAALVDRDALLAWLPPDGMTGRFERFDPRPGGSYRLVLTYIEDAGAPGKATTNTDIVEVPAGTELIREGESGREFFAIAEGEVEVSQAGRPIATEETGDVFGELALLHGIPRTATVTATEPSRLFVVDSRAFRSVLADSFA